MKILLARDHIYAPNKLEGSGKIATNMPSGSSHFQHDLLAKGLAEKGHEIFYYVKHGENVAPPLNVKFTDTLIDDVDIVHIKAPGELKTIQYYLSKDIPILATNHGYRPEMKPLCNWVHVSKTQANLHNATDYIWNALDPSDFIFSDQKKDYFLFIANMRYHKGKGLDIALKLSKDLNFKLVVAGSSKQQEDVDLVEALCKADNATYVGDVRGIKKTALMSNAKALISPSQLPETFGMTLVEALFSGTPVICSGNGAYSEIMSNDVGFVCRNEADYHLAINSINKINPTTCKTYAMNNFHYHKMTEKYLTLYNKILKKKPVI